MSFAVVGSASRWLNRPDGSSDNRRATEPRAGLQHEPSSDSAMPKAAGRRKSPAEAPSATGLAGAIGRVAAAAEAVLGGNSPRTAQARNGRAARPATRGGAAAAAPPPAAPGIKKRGGSKKGRTQVKKPKGYQARRRAAVLYQYEQHEKEILAMEKIPDIVVGAPKKGEKPHIARLIASAITKEGDRPPATSWVLNIIREIKAVGVENYDARKDGRSAKRKPRKNARPPVPPK